MKLDLTRRAFVGSLAVAGLPAADAGWIELFDGHSLRGWRPSENRTTWKVANGQLAADGPRSQLFYDGPVSGANFRNFELEVEAMARPGCDSGIYFHTAYQEQGFPPKGFEVQIANTAGAENGYQERQKTGSLSGLRHVYKQFLADDHWFRMTVAVRGKNVQVRLNGMLLVEYIEPDPPVIPDGGERGRFLDRGTFALQCHSAGSRVLFRSIRVRPLADYEPTPAGEAPVVDATYRQILDIGRHNVPMVDYHVHLKDGLTLEQALAKSRADGIEYGIAINCGRGFPVDSDAGARSYLESMRGQPIFVAMQGEGREWTQVVSRSSVAGFDYVFTDSMTWTDNNGLRRRLWLPDELGPIPDVEEFMDLLVDRTVGILEREPIDIYANPTYLPDRIAKDYDKLWTEQRMKKVIDAAKRGGVAIELNTRRNLPSVAFIQMARAAGCKFAFGTNNAGPSDLHRCEYGLRVVGECKLTWQDFFVPGAWCEKAVDRKPEALKG
jgi:hypothetical protein